MKQNSFELASESNDEFRSEIRDLKECIKALNEVIAQRDETQAEGKQGAAEKPSMFKP
jgi:peptidoglycan hydrolase CwlO-like protein